MPCTHPNDALRLNQRLRVIEVHTFDVDADGNARLDALCDEVVVDTDSLWVTCTRCGTTLTASEERAAGLSVDWTTS